MMSETERVDRFEAAYNRIDQGLDELLKDKGGRRRQGFTSKVRTAANRIRRFARYADFLLEIAELRNAIVHNRTGDEFFIAVPNEETVLELEKIEQRIVAPERVTPRFQKVVLTVEPETTLDETWKKISDNGISRFPVYGREGCLGLLTSNGIGRWCAKQVKGGRLEIDAKSVTVGEVMTADTRRERIAYVARPPTPVVSALPTWHATP
jgi:CBS domain-containing protein